MNNMETEHNKEGQQKTVHDKLFELEQVLDNSDIIIDYRLSNASIYKMKEWINNVRKDLEVNPKRWTPAKIEERFSKLLESFVEVW